MSHTHFRGGPSAACSAHRAVSMAAAPAAQTGLEWEQTEAPTPSSTPPAHSSHCLTLALLWNKPSGPLCCHPGILPLEFGNSGVKQGWKH